MSAHSRDTRGHEFGGATLDGRVNPSFGETFVNIPRIGVREWPEYIVRGASALNGHCSLLKYFVNSNFYIQLKSISLTKSSRIKIFYKWKKNSDKNFKSFLFGFHSIYWIFKTYRQFAMPCMYKPLVEKSLSQYWHFLRLLMVWVFERFLVWWALTWWARVRLVESILPHWRHSNLFESGAFFEAMPVCGIESKFEILADKPLSGKESKFEGFDSRPSGVTQS